MVSAGTFNLIEGLVWLAAGAGCIGYALWRLDGLRRRLLLWAGADLVLFALTDFYEMRTGAWWDPPWLAALKVLCIVAFLVIYVIYLRNREQ